MAQREATEQPESGSDLEALRQERNRLHNLGIRLNKLGKREASLKTTRGAVMLASQLAERDPDAFLPGLARALNSLGDHLRESGDPAGAWAAYTEGVQLYAPFFLRRPPRLHQADGVDGPRLHRPCPGRRPAP